MKRRDLERARELLLRLGNEEDRTRVLELRRKVVDARERLQDLPALT